MKIVTAEEMREIDRITTEKHGVPSLTLMENAGRAVAEEVLSRYAPQRALVICGKGNNGGDGFAAGRHLAEAGVGVEVVALHDASEYSGDAAAMLAKLARKPKVTKTESGIREVAAKSDHAVIVDAILGTGFHPPLTELYAAAIDAVNQSGVPVHAVDIPSGLEADRMTAQHGPHVQAESTTTFTALKPVHVFTLEPETVTVRQIGTPPEAVSSKLQLNLIDAGSLAFLGVPRKRESNKGDYGHVLVLGGSTGKSGAAAMTGMAALRAGAGLVSVACPKSVLSTVASFAPELMTVPLEETTVGGFSVVNFEQMRTLAEGKRVVAVGPGAGLDEETQQFIRAFVDRCEVPVVLDADGLNAFAGHAQNLTPIRHPLILTPHPGEMARLVKQTVAEVQNNRINTARWFAQEHGCYLVLKGHRTLVAEPSGEVWINTTGNPGMATGGTGDVLTGILAGLVAQYPQRIGEAVSAAVYLHGRAGDIAAEHFGERAVIATDLISALPEAFQEIAVTPASTNQQRGTGA